MSRSRRTGRNVQVFLMFALLVACAGRKPAQAPEPAVVTSAAEPAPASTAPPVTTPPTVTPVVTASSPAPDSTAGPSILLPKAPKPRNDRQLLTRDAILATQYTNMFEVIQSLRGNWLRARTAESIQGRSSTVQIYLDNQRLSGADELKSIAPTNVESVRYYDPIQASSRWGLDHGAGAIYILTSTRR